MPLPHSLIIVLFILAAISGCSSSNNADLVDTEQEDTTPPSVLSFKPDVSGNDTRIETDQTIEIVFSELINLDSLSSGLELTIQDITASSGNDDSSEAPSVFSAPFNTVIDQIPTQYVDPVTDIEQETLATRVKVYMPTFFSPNALYKLTLTNQIKDRSSTKSYNPVSGELTTGNFFSDNNEFEFLTNEGQWFSPSFETFGLTDSDVYTYSILEDDDRTYLIWGSQQKNSTNQQLHSSAFSLSAYAWQALDRSSSQKDPIPLSVDAYGKTISPSLFKLNNGQLTAIWIQANTLTNSRSLYMSVFDGTSWNSEPTQLTQTPSVSIESASLIANNQGQYILVWSELEGSTSRIMQGILDLDSPTPQITNVSTLVAESNQTISDLKATSNETQIFIQWIQNQSGTRSSHLSRLYKDNNFEFTSLHSSNSSNDSPSLSFSVSDSGQGLLAWQEINSNRYDIWRAWYNGSSIQTPELAERDNSGSATLPHTSICYGGIASLVWLQESSGSLDNKLHASVYNPKLEGWEEPEVLKTTTAKTLKVNSHFDRSCNMILTWSNETNLSWEGSQYSMLDKAWKDSNFLSNTNNNAFYHEQSRLGDSGRHLTVRSRFNEDRYVLEYALFDSAELAP